LSFFTKQHATVTFSDGATPTPASITFDDVGDFSIDGLQEAGKSTATIIHRGAFKSYVYGDEAPVTGSFSLTVKAEDFSNAGSSRPLDFIMKLGSVASGTTTNPGGFGPWCGTMVYSVTANGQTGSIQVTECRLSASITESGDALVASVSFTGYIGTIN
jgi:hypothetical protein